MGGFDPLWSKVKLINHSTYLFRGVGGFDPLWREVDVNKPFNILVQSGWGHLIPYEAKWKLINHSTYLFRGVGGFDPLSREVEVNKTIQHTCSEGGFDPSWREVEVNLSFNIFVQRGGFDPLWTFDSPVECVPVKLKDVSAGYQDCLKAAGYSPCLCHQRVACLEGVDHVWFR